MTTAQLYLFDGVYLVLSVIAAVLTRATARRIAGALAGGLAAGVGLLAIVAVGEQARLWHQTLRWEPYLLTLVMIGCALCAYIFLITWRIARRFGRRGLLTAMLVAAAIGPARDYWYMAHFPEWGAYAWGVATILTVSAAYVLLGILGHGVMRLVAGPAQADRLSRRPWETASSTARTDR